jgi:UDP-glucose:(heptosyl)LPS alpha-1,3-glucosyltransferase
MRLGFVLTSYFPYGGLQRDCLKTAKVCAERGHQVTIFTRNWEGQQPENISVELMGKKGLTNLALNRHFSKQLKKTLPRRNLDGIIGFSRIMVPMDLYYGADPCYIAKVKRLKGKWFQWTARYWHFKTLEKFIFNPGQKTQILLLTPHEIALYQEYYGTESNRFHVLPPGIQKHEYSQQKQENVKARIFTRMGWSKQDQLLLFIGSNFRLKGLDRALRGVASLSKEVRKHIRFIVIGRDNPQRFIALAKELGIAQSVYFLGGRMDATDFFLAADLLMHPAHSESAGIVLLEALSFGTAVLTTDTCGYAFHIEKAKAGYVLPSPFKQSHFNAYLEKMLTQGHLFPLQRNALEYASHEDLYSCHEKAADIIEQTIQEKFRKRK